MVRALKQAGNPKPLDIRKTAVEQLAKFREINHKPHQKPELDEQQAKLVQELTKSSSYYIFTLRNALHTVQEPEKAFQAGYAAALTLLENGNWEGARLILDGVYDEYLFGDRSSCPEQLGSQALDRVNTINRTWVYAHANSLLGGRTPKEFRRTDLYGTDIWSADGVIVLGKTGMLEDLPLLDRIGKRCGESTLEGYCGEAISSIIARAALNYAFDHSSTDELAQFGLLCQEYARPQIIARLELLLSTLGVNTLLRGLYRNRMGEQLELYGPLDAMLSTPGLSNLCEEGLGRRMRVWQGGGSEGERRMKATVKFLAERELAKEGEEDEKVGERTIQRDIFWLTEKGEEMVRFLMNKLRGSETQARAMLPDERKELE